MTPLPEGPEEEVAPPTAAGCRVVGLSTAGAKKTHSCHALLLQEPRQSARTQITHRLPAWQTRDRLEWGRGDPTNQSAGARRGGVRSLFKLLLFSQLVLSVRSSHPSASPSCLWTIFPLDRFFPGRFFPTVSLLYFFLFCLLFSFLLFSLQLLPPLVQPKTHDATAPQQHNSRFNTPPARCNSPLPPRPQLVAQCPCDLIGTCVSVALLLCSPLFACTHNERDRGDPQAHLVAPGRAGRRHPRRQRQAGPLHPASGPCREVWGCHS